MPEATLRSVLPAAVWLRIMHDTRKPFRGAKKGAGPEGDAEAERSTMSSPISMPWQAPVFPPPPHRWEGVQVAIFPFAPQSETVARILPPGIEPREGLGLMTMLCYPRGSGDYRLHPFNEMVALVPVTVDGVEANYVPNIYVNTDEALIAGREIAGWPKRLADITWERDGSSFRGTVSRWGERILELEGELAGPMPEELRAMQAQSASTPTVNYKLIPGPAGEIEVEEITLSRLDIVPHQIEMGTGSVKTFVTDDDTLGELVGASEGPLIVMRSDNTIPAAEVLKRIEGRVGA